MAIDYRTLGVRRNTILIIIELNYIIIMLHKTFFYCLIDRKSRIHYESTVLVCKGTDQ